jgi:hypothetical protein
MSLDHDLKIEISGADKSGKGHLIALIANYLTDVGCVVTVQGATGHNAPKLAKEKQELLNRLQNSKIVITEMQTSK